MRSSAWRAALLLLGRCPLLSSLIASSAAHPPQCLSSPPASASSAMLRSARVHLFAFVATHTPAALSCLHIIRSSPLLVVHDAACNSFSTARCGHQHGFPRARQQAADEGTGPPAEGPSAQRRRLACQGEPSQTTRTYASSHISSSFRRVPPHSLTLLINPLPPRPQSCAALQTPPTKAASSVSSSTSLTRLNPPTTPLPRPHSALLSLHPSHSTSSSPLPFPPLLQVPARPSLRYLPYPAVPPQRGRARPHLPRHALSPSQRLLVTRPHPRLPPHHHPPAAGLPQRPGRAGEGGGGRVQHGPTRVRRTREGVVQAACDGWEGGGRRGCRG